MRPLVLCPLEFERRRLERAGTDRVAELACCGPGADAARHAVRVLPAGRTVILAGTAGSLVGEVPAGSARVVTAVRAADGATWTPPLVGDATRCVVTSVARPVRGAARAALHAGTGAHLVDLESVAFAAAAVSAGVRWAVVRAVSDDPGHELPAAVDDMVAPSGRTRPLRAAVALLRRPRLAGELARLRAHAASGLAEAAGLLEALLIG